MNRLSFAVAVAGALFVATPSAQAQIRRSTGTISTSGPTSTSVPAGMCQIWINGLPANRQPAPTDCNSAQRNVPSNGRVIYGSRSYPNGTTRNGQYDPRYDPRSSQYDPRLNPSNQNGNYGTYGQNSRDRAKWERMQAKERAKEWKKAHKGNNGNDADDNNGNRGQRGQSGQHGHNDH